MKKLLSALFLVALCSSLAMATVPDPLNCTITPLLGPGIPQVPATQVAFLAPGNLSGTTITITVRNHANDVIPNASVVVVFHTDISICTTANHTATTNALGVCTIALRGGGCLTNVTDACRVIANGIEIRNLRYVRSPDNDDHAASAPDGAVTVGDLTFFAAEFGGTAPTVPPSVCHDYDNSGVIDVVDLTYFGPSFTSNMVCPI